MTFERWIEFDPAYDKRADGYGIHGATMRCLLRVPAGVVQFVLYTNWMLPSATIDRADHLLCRPMPADLGYHSPEPRYDGQSRRDDCPYLPGSPCYYDGSALNAEPVFSRLVAEGSDGLWAALEEFYASIFGPQ